MSTENFNRRQFLQTALYSSLLYGVGSVPKLMSPVNAMPYPLQNRILVDLFLDGGPDMRHLIVPAYSSNTNSFGYKYWSNRTRSHNLSGSGQTPLQRWNEDYYHITVGGNNWNSGIFDYGNLNTGVTFGIWKEAGWLIDMFRAGNAALIFNAVGGTNRAHDLSSLMLQQGDVLTSLNNQDRSGWGGRLARSAGGNPIGLTSSPSPFTFGPVGDAPNYNPHEVDNRDLIVVNDSRNLGLFDPEESGNSPHNDFDNKMSRAAKGYYAALRQEQIGEAYQKFMDHELKTREFGKAIAERVASTPIPEVIEALYSNNVTISGQPANPDPSDGSARRVLRSTSFGRQIRNLYDMIAWNNVSVNVGGEVLALNPRVLSLEYGGWDTHGDQRQYSSSIASDPANPSVNRGIESNLRDVFEGQFGSSPSNSSALHGGLSALWQNLNSADRNNIVLTIAGEFGRQIRDNGDGGTDHGKGNLMMVISERCQGGIYGEMFPQSEISKYDDDSIRTPDIDPRTEFDQFFSKVCDWVEPNSGSEVFPRMSSGYSGASPFIEVPGMFDNLLS
ncbi:MAG: DUF1501 domain-containing protein [Acidiferrobacterales bacterium]|nr:DUF1501 domain-containing protein [Acidiferrobacterales bacterium]